MLGDRRGLSQLWPPYSPCVTINFSKMITNPSHQTDSRRAAKDVDICYTNVLDFSKMMTEEDLNVLSKVPILNGIHC